MLDPVPRVSNPVGLWWELRMYISNKFLGDAEAVGVLRQAMCVCGVRDGVLHADYCSEQ